ncbi:MAG: hypothetical protein FWD37_03215 [Methanomassiliicoccaceae archaeon]|nr:hypothetical protein [Methanomassiliicoccaceae archaeon]
MAKKILALLKKMVRLMKRSVIMALVAAAMLVAAIPLGLAAAEDDDYVLGANGGATGGGDNSFNLDAALATKGNGNNNGNWFRVNEFIGNAGTFDLVSGAKLDVVGAYGITYANGLFTLTVLGGYEAANANLSISNSILQDVKNANELSKKGIDPKTAIWTSAPGQQAFSFSGKSFTFAADWVSVDVPVYVYLNISLVKSKVAEPPIDPPEPVLGSITAQMKISAIQPYMYISNNTSFTGGDYVVGNQSWVTARSIPLDAILYGVTFSYDLISANGIVGTYNISANENGDLVIAFNNGQTAVGSLYVIFGNEYKGSISNSLPGNAWNNGAGLVRVQGNNTVSTVVIPAEYISTLEGDQYLFMQGTIPRGETAEADISDRFIFEVFVWDSNGELVKAAWLGNGQILNVNDLKAGVYTITVNAGDNWTLIYQPEIVVDGDDVETFISASVIFPAILI